MFSIAQNTQRDSELSREEKREGGGRSDLGEKRESQKGRDQSSSNHTPKRKWVLKIRFLKVQN